MASILPLYPRVIKREEEIKRTQVVTKYVALQAFKLICSVRSSSTSTCVFFFINVKRSIPVITPKKASSMFPNKTEIAIVIATNTTIDDLIIL